LASALTRISIEPGDRVAVLAPNTPLALEPHFAVPLAGAVLVMLNTRLQAAELAWILNHCGAKVLLADPQLLPILDPVMDDLKQLTSSPTTTKRCSRRANSPSPPPSR